MTESLEDPWSYWRRVNFHTPCPAANLKAMPRGSQSWWQGCKGGLRSCASVSSAGDPSLLCTDQLSAQVPRRRPDSSERLPEVSPSTGRRAGRGAVRTAQRGFFLSTCAAAVGLRPLRCPTFPWQWAGGPQSRSHSTPTGQASSGQWWSTGRRGRSPDTVSWVLLSALESRRASLSRSSKSDWAPVLGSPSNGAVALALYPDPRGPLASVLGSKAEVRV